MSYPFFCEKGIRALTIDKDNAPKVLPPPLLCTRVHVCMWHMLAFLRSNQSGHCFYFWPCEGQV
jgi:hypothetical protein